MVETSLTKKMILIKFVVFRPYLDQHFSEFHEISHQFAILDGFLGYITNNRYIGCKCYTENRVTSALHRLFTEPGPVAASPSEPFFRFAFATATWKARRAIEDTWSASSGRARGFEG